MFICLLGEIKINNKYLQTYIFFVVNTQKKAAPFRVFALFSSRNIRGFEPERVPALRKQFSELFLAGSDAAGYWNALRFGRRNHQYARHSRSIWRIPYAPPRRRGLHIVRDGFFYCLCKSLLSLIPSLLLSPQSPIGFVGTPNQTITFSAWYFVYYR